MLRVTCFLCWVSASINKQLASEGHAAGAQLKFVTSLHMQEVAALAMENVNLRASEAHLRTAAAAACGTASTAEDSRQAPASDSAALAAHEAAVTQRVAAAGRYTCTAKGADSSRSGTANAKVHTVWQGVN